MSNRLELKHDFEKRIFGLDLLRFFAIFFVVYSHGNKLIRDYADTSYLKYLHFDGVSIFFVLSGFLIGRILIKRYLYQEDYSFKVIWNFWIRRWMRTLPVYFVVLTFLALFDVFSKRNYDGYFIEYYTFTQNLWYNHPSFFPEAWSLSVEEWFYLTIPILLLISTLIFRRKNIFVLSAVIISFILGGIVYKYFKFMNLEADVKHLQLVKIFGKQVFSRLPSIMYGVLAALISLRYKDFWFKVRWPAFVIGLVILYFYKITAWKAHPFYYSVLAFDMVSLGTMLILPLAYATKKVKGFLSKFIVHISIISYSMYLINRILRNTIRKVNPVDSAQDAYIDYAIYWILLILISSLMYFFIEKPVLKYRDKISSIMKI